MKTTPVLDPEVVVFMTFNWSQTLTHIQTPFPLSVLQIFLKRTLVNHSTQDNLSQLVKLIRTYRRTRTLGFLLPFLFSPMTCLNKDFNIILGDNQTKERQEEGSKVHRLLPPYIQSKLK